MRRKHEKRNAFTDLVKKVGEIDATVLASAEPYRPVSSEAESLAQHMVGAVAARSTAGARVRRVAALLDDLFAADAAQTSHSKRQHAG